MLPALCRPLGQGSGTLPPLYGKEAHGPHRSHGLGLMTIISVAGEEGEALEVLA